MKFMFMPLFESTAYLWDITIVKNDRKWKTSHWILQGTPVYCDNTYI